MKGKVVLIIKHHVLETFFNGSTALVDPGLFSVS
jgi:hypothetical protein